MGESIYYPSCVVNFRLRFDEVFRVSELPEAGRQGGELDSESQTAPAASSTLNLIRGLSARRAEGPVPDSRPLITQTGDSNLSFVVNRVPRSASVTLPGYRQAGQFSLEFDWRELPIDPRLIRSCGIEIFFGTVSPDDFATGMTRVEPDGRRRSVLNTKYVGGGRGVAGVTRDDLMVLAGVVDTWALTQSGDGGVIKMDGRDLRSIFIDSPIDQAAFAKLDLLQPINEVVKTIVKKHPAGQYIEVISNEQDWPEGRIPNCLDKGGLTRVRKKADGESSSGGGAGGGSTTYWDLITQYCFLVGAVPYFRARNVVIRPARALFDQSKPKSFTFDKVFDPETRIDDNGNPFSTRRMVFGRNISELTFERKLSGTKVPVVEVVSFDTSSPERGAKKMLIAQWPPANATLARISGVSPSGEVSQEDKTRVSVPGIRDMVQLVAIAKNIYEEIGRGELGGSCKTGALASFKGGNEDPDLLRLRPGDAVEFITDSRPLDSKVPSASTYADSSRTTFSEAVKNVRTALYGKAEGGDENLVRVIAASARSQVIGLLRTFRVANVVFNWSTSSGTQLSFDFQNYVTLRSGITQQLGANTEAPVSVTAASTRAKKPKIEIGPASVTPVPQAAKPARRVRGIQNDALRGITNDLEKGLGIDLTRRVVAAESEAQGKSVPLIDPNKVGND